MTNVSGTDLSARRESVGARRWPALFHYQAYEPEFAARLLALGTRYSKPHVVFFGAALLALLLWTQLPPAVALRWLAGVLASALFGFWLNSRHRRLGPDLRPGELRRAEWANVLYGAAMGAAWGASSQLMEPGEAAHNIVVMVFFAGGTALIGATTFISLARLLAGTVSTVAIFLAPLPEVFPQDWPQLALILSLFVVFTGSMAWERNQIYVANLRLQHENERLLAQQRAETERANQANQEKSAFLAAASHDLRQPLHALMLTSHALSLRTPAGEGRVMVERILEAGGVLAEQFNHLMDLSRLESGAYRLKLGTVPLAPLLQQVVAAHRQVAENRGIQLRMRLDRRLQSAALHTDPGLLGRLLDNLVDNAIKFSDAGMAVLLSARQGAGRITLGVHDQGIGIPAEQQANVFKPYVQLDNPTRDLSRGIGLGLSIVHGAAALLGGRLGLRSRPAHGSHFTLVLSADLVRAAPAATAAIHAAQAERLRGKSLLLVEDDAMAATALVAWGANWGLRVLHHADPATVPATLRPDLIVCDIHLPGARDGIELLSEWLAQWPEARGLLLSGELSAQAHQRAEQEGLLLLSKPANPELLLQTLIGMTQD